MQESGEFSPSAATPGRPFLVAAGLVAAGVLGLLGLYQGFSLTWRQYPQLQSPSRSASAPVLAAPAAPVAVASEAAMEVPIADHHQEDAAPPPAAQDGPPPDERAPSPAPPIQANTVDAAALTPAADTPAPPPIDPVPPVAPPSSPSPDLNPSPGPPPASE